MNAVPVTNTTFYVDLTSGSPSWQPGGTMVNAVAGTGLETDHQGYIWALGGFNALGAAGADAIQRYDVAADTWTEILRDDNNLFPV